jgi:hypothetical protein
VIGIIEKHLQIVTSCEIKRYRQYGGAYEFVAQIDLVDGQFCLYVITDIFNWLRFNHRALVRLQ